uniref:Uncharacterized protein n=1 Tax=Corethron hystrix TaxID=216773 RepID=A0A7S1BH85_9STRA|mmetsp:Transcript_27705/g.63486  ORF Transcript_27705/g.63486 Transcript_27705/m.63486 type:complete len:100 (+) Transcript_27705:731-1030(+)
MQKKEGCLRPWQDPAYCKNIQQSNHRRHVKEVRKSVLMKIRCGVRRRLPSLPDVTGGKLSTGRSCNLKKRSRRSNGNSWMSCDQRAVVDVKSENVLDFW